jgi:hypothetical protein
MECNTYEGDEKYIINFGSKTWKEESTTKTH